MNVLAFVLQTTTIQVPSPPAPDVTAIVVRLLSLLPLAAGYLLAREGRGNLLFEVLAVLFLVLATAVPFDVTASTSLTEVLTNFLTRWPVMVFLLGLAFVRDGGYKILLGVLLMAISGVIVLAPK